MKLDGRLAFITGGGRGIGRAIAHAFAAEGAGVAVAARTLEEVNAVAKEIATEFGTDALALTCDVQQRESVNEAFDSFRAHLLIQNNGAARPLHTAASAQANRARQRTPLVSRRRLKWLRHREAARPERGFPLRVLPVR